MACEFTPPHHLPAPMENCSEIVYREIRHLAILFDEKLAKRDLTATLKAEALKLQAVEYERRLAALNHEHQKNEERNAEFVSSEKYDAFVKDTAVYRTGQENSIAEKSANLEKSVREKAEALEKSVREKAEALEKSVNEKAELLKSQFQAFREETEKATERITGSKLGSNKVLTLVVSLVGFLWATSSVISTVQNIYVNMQKTTTPSQVSVENKDAIAKLQARIDAMSTAAKPTPSPMPVTIAPAPAPAPAP